MAADALPEWPLEDWTTNTATLSFDDTEVTVPPAEVEQSVRDVQRTYSVLGRSFGPDAVLSDDGPEPVAEQRGFRLNTATPDQSLVGTDDPEVLDRLSAGLAVADGTPAVAHLARDDEQALSFAEISSTRARATRSAT